jgi:hypothetical protein
MISGADNNRNIRIYVPDIFNKIYSMHVRHFNIGNIKVYFFFIQLLKGLFTAGSGKYLPGHLAQHPVIGF